MTWRLRRSYPLRTLFITINLLVLALPIVGIATLRIFENVLHRQTEAKLSAEGAYIHALYLETLADVVAGSTSEVPLVRRLKDPDRPVDDRWRPYFPTIDVSKDPVLPAGPEGKVPARPPHPLAVRAGQMIQPILIAAQRMSLSGVRVLDANGVVVASNGGELGKDFSDREEVRRALQGHYCSVLRERTRGPRPPLHSISRASRVRVYVAIPIMFDAAHLAGVVYLHRTSLTFFRDLWENQYAAALLIIVALTLLISLLLAVIVTRPLKSMIGQAERIAAGESGGSLEVGGWAPTEAHQLAHALSRMVTKLKERMEYVEHFTKNVSHEFKTPLTSIQGAIEILEDEGAGISDEQRARFLGIMRSQVRRMELLVRKLIELARIEMALPQDRITDLVELIDHIAHRHHEAGHDVKVEKRVEQATARIDPDMAETMFANLIENAVVHGGGAPVRVEIEAGPTVKVIDRGPGISEANLPRIFDRFFTTNRSGGGTGLGLSLVKAIADVHGAAIEVASSPAGTTFTVKLKPAGPANSD